MVDTIARNGDDSAMRYDGGKGISFPQIVNLMPPHKRYIETHLGGGAVMRNKLPATDQVGLDVDPTVIEMWKLRWPDHCDVIRSDAVDYLSAQHLDADTLIYADPPYHPDTRRRLKVYRHDYSVRDHERLLDCLTALPCKVIISGYVTPLYERWLSGWSVHRFRARTHVDTREEWVWFNYLQPELLHDDRYFGAGFREREVIRRRQERLRRRIDKLSAVEQKSLYSWLKDRADERAWT
ncbi:MAG: DNA adenine methylase [Sterolibacterium sp.]